MKDFHGHKYLNMGKQLEVHKWLKRKRRSTSSLGGCDPIGDELGGVDEEWRYFKNVDHVVINQPENHEVEVQNRNRARPIP